MNLSRRVLSPGVACALFVVLVLLVVGGLGWVTASALRVERAQQETATSAELAGRERLALWRMDGLLFPVLALENSRPFAHYTALHAAFPAVDLGGGEHGPPLLTNPAVRLPSPLLSADLPAWMPLHFQLDPVTGWDSPQVLPVNVVERLQAGNNYLELDNVTPQRAGLLEALRANFPAAEAIAALAERDRAAGSGSLFLVPVPAASEPSLPKMADARAGTEALTRSPPTTPAGYERPTVTAAPPGFARSNTAEVANPAQPQSALLQNGLQSRAGGNTATPQMLGAQVAGRSGDLSNTNSDEYAARARAAKQMTERGGTPQGGGFGGGQGGFGGQLGFGGGFNGAQFGQMPPAPGGPPAPMIASSVASPATAAEAKKDVGDGRASKLAEAPRDLESGKDFAQKESGARNGAVLVSDDLIPGARAARKGAPTLPPMAVHVGPIRAEWLRGLDGREALVLVRAAHLESKTVYQGALLDAEQVRGHLREQVADLFPNGEVTKVLTPEALAPERAMTALPLQLDPGPAPEPPPVGWTPLRRGLLLAWGTVLLAVTAVGFGGRALLDLSERRIRFVSAVTHELRTPLTSLRLYLDLLTSGLVDDDPAKQKEYLHTLAGESERLHRLIENVLDFARLENRRGTATLEPTPVAAILDALQQTWGDRCLAEGKQLVVHSLVPPGQLVRTDARVAEQILCNLIDNARKYSRDAADNRIWLRARPSADGRVAFEVEDRGPGVPPAERRRVFRPFRRGETADTVAGGAGLGLALAQHWTELARGKLTYRPADGGQGACFRLELPTK